MRGTIEALARSMGGAGVRIEIEPLGEPPLRACPVSGYESKEPGGCAAVVLHAAEGAGVRIGLMGLLSNALRQQMGLETGVVMAELDLGAMLALFPGRSLVRELPAFPSIERDLSLIVGEDVSWAQLDAMVRTAGVERLEHAAFIGTYRGPQAGPGRKSVTLRLRFRDPGRTLRHEEVDGPVERLVLRAKEVLSAELRVV